MHPMVKAAEPRMQKAYDHMLEELKSIQTGRASVQLLDGVRVESYGQMMQVNQVASLNTPDAKTIVVTPWDATMLAPIEKAIQTDQALGLNPKNDGKSLYINIPPLTEERRTGIAKIVGEKSEEANISLRNVRHDVMNEAKKAAKDKEIGEDEQRKIEKEIGELLENFRKQIDEAAEAKRKEIMTI